MKMHLCLQSHKQPVPKKQDVPFDLIWRIHTYSWDERENTVLWMKLKMFDMCDHRPQPSQGQIDGQKKKKKKLSIISSQRDERDTFCWLLLDTSDKKVYCHERYSAEDTS
jgi:hypothetical protein